MSTPKILGNYTTQSNNDFPFDCETLKYIQENAAIAEMIGSIAGNKVILSGCGLTDNNTKRAAGYVFIKTQDYPNGEVLYFEGGSVQSGLRLKKDNISVSAGNNSYPSAYTKRYLKAESGGEHYVWSDFTDLSGKTNRELKDQCYSLQTQIDGLVPAPIGSIMMYPSDNIPANWHKCDGSALSTTQYAALYAVIGTSFGGSGNQFNLPNMKGRFVVGKEDNNNNNYGNIGNTGGQNKVTLTAAESGLPEHRHEILVTQKNWQDQVNRPDYIDTKTSELASAYTELAGGTDAQSSHENRPPFIVMNYIIKIS